MEILKKSRSKSSLWVHMVYILLILALGTGSVYLFLENHRLAGEIGRLKKNLTGEPVVVFFVEPQSNDIKIKPFLCPVKPFGNRHLQALQILLDGPGPGSKLAKLFPEGTKILSFTLQNGLATVNLNQRVTEMNVGSTLEALAVISIVNTLTKFPDVYRVKILIEGKEVESLAGHVDLSTELHYSDFGVDPVPGELK
jgi:spore germination protein GerM